MANNNKREALFSHQDITPCVTAVDAANNMSAHYHVYVYDTLMHVTLDIMFNMFNNNMFVKKSVGIANLIIV